MPVGSLAWYQSFYHTLKNTDEFPTHAFSGKVGYYYNHALNIQTPSSSVDYFEIHMRYTAAAPDDERTEI